jgi:hypothetical protein
MGSVGGVSNGILRRMDSEERGAWVFSDISRWTHAHCIVFLLLVTIVILIHSFTGVIDVVMVTLRDSSSNVIIIFIYLCLFQLWQTTWQTTKWKLKLKTLRKRWSKLVDTQRMLKYTMVWRERPRDSINRKYYDWYKNSVVWKNMRRRIEKCRHAWLMMISAQLIYYLYFLV